ncbi:MAG: hypothetical protein AB7G48_10780 [Nitrospiraceae bacterium]
MSVAQGERGLLLRCFAGCELSAICAALNIRVSDLFHDAALPRGSRPPNQPTTARFDPVRTAFEFEQTALDLRQRAEAVLRAASGLDTSTWTDEDFDCAMDAVAQARRDLERATILEDVADTLRFRDYDQGKARDAKQHERRRTAA